MKKPNPPNASFSTTAAPPTGFTAQTKTEAPRKTRLQQLEVENTQLKKGIKFQSIAILERNHLLDQKNIQIEVLEGRLADIQQILNEFPQPKKAYAGVGNVIRVYEPDKTEYLAWLERLRGALKNDK